MSKIKIYKASAGSGKTYTLALEYIKQLLLSANNRNYRHILAVTFTKDATGEMKDRVLSELYGLAFYTNDSSGFFNSLSESLKESGKDWDEKYIRNRAEKILYNILHDYSRLNITTIDSFFQKVVRNLARELGKGSKYNLEMNTNKVLKEAVHSTIAKADKNKQILDWLTTYIEHKLNEDKNWRIEDEIFEFSKCIYNEFFQEHEQSLRKQLDENPKLFFQIKSQQEEIKKACRSFFIHTNLKVKQLLQERDLLPDDFIRKGIPVLFFQKLADGNYSIDVTKTIQDCCDDASSWTSKTHKRRNEIVALAENELIFLLTESIKTRRIMLTAQMITGNLHQLGLIWDITEEISEQNAENNRFMLSDTAMFLNRMIDRSDAPFIYEKLGADIRHVMIDEFQDTSRLQWNNFKVLLADIAANNHFSLIVGDVKQSIYRWRNGDWRILNNIEQELKTKSETLKYNYRSEKAVVFFNNTFFVHAANLLNRYYIENLNNSAEPLFTSVYKEEDVVQKSNKSVQKGFVSVEFLSSEDDAPYTDLMKEAVFRQINKLYENNISAGNICILTRTNKEIIALADYLSSLKSEYPELARNDYLNIISNEAFQLQSSPTVKIIIEALRMIADRENAIAKEQLNYFLNAFERTYPDNFESSSEWVLMPLFELIGCLYRLFQLEKIDGQSAYVFSFYDSLIKYLNENRADIKGFLQHWDSELKIKTIPAGSSVSGVRAMTIHKSKGLQFHSVIIPYCDWNMNPKANTVVWCGSKEGFESIELLPISYSSKMGDTIFAEEYKEETAQSWIDNLNILYVAFTRAEHNLIILSKYKKELEKKNKISSVSDLLQLSVPYFDSNGNWDEETGIFESGELDRSLSAKETTTDNPLKQEPESMKVSFVSQAFQPGKAVFKQSNKSREFIHPEKGIKEKYVSYGNIMHHLFERIGHWNQIEESIDHLIIQGLIHPNEKESYAQNMIEAIKQSQVEHWFNGNYKSYPEQSIIMEETGEIRTKRPDRVLFSENETIVIDYKFGKRHNTHHKQVEEYMELLSAMNYPNIKGFLWYVEERKVVPV
ncbi:MAG: UvrD-helicase domain-containing protein [Dysgonamonadaceae bacterium]|jgi:ATP-dependent exoDNAse (exonuclease V) beta subunit|nr:UvrD-helicase domain-containing protein [Dysgonamonadaceae bacterium]